MSKFIRVVIETGIAGGDTVEIVELDDNASQKDMEEAARDEFFNRCSYGWSECDEEGNEL
jgi:hypothetical protein